MYPIVSQRQNSTRTTRNAERCQSVCAYGPCMYLYGCGWISRGWKQATQRTQMKTTTNSQHITHTKKMFTKITKNYCSNLIAFVFNSNKIETMFTVWLDRRRHTITSLIGWAEIVYGAVVWFTRSISFKYPPHSHSCPDASVLSTKNVCEFHVQIPIQVHRTHGYHSSRYIHVSTYSRSAPATHQKKQQQQTGCISQ